MKNHKLYLLELICQDKRAAVGNFNKEKVILAIGRVATPQPLS